MEETKHNNENQIISRLIGFTPFVAILILSCLPAFYTWGRLPIWGDTIIPFNSNALTKYLYQWDSLQNGQYLSINYLPYFLFFKWIELFTYNIYYISAILLFSLKLTAGLGIYKLSKLLYDNQRPALYTLPVVFYLLSPAQLNASYYLYIYSFAPWFIYFIFKVIKHSRITIPDLLWVSILLFFSSINLPNPKYVFHLITIAVLIFCASFLFKLVSIQFFTKNIWKLAILLLMSAYLFLPQLAFVSYYNSDKYDVHIKAGYKDVGQMMDYGESTLPRMFKLHKDTLNLNAEARKQYNSNALIDILSYSFLVLIVGNVIFGNCKDKIRKKHQYLLLLLLLVYLFFATGSNPPFGYFYQRMVESFSLFAFLRTTAGATFFLSIFYALLLFPVALNQKTIAKKYLVSFFLIISICVTGYPLLNGESYKNVKIASPSTDTSKRGIVIPGDYFDVQEQLGSLKLDAKTLFTNPEYSYIATYWGYFGVPIYDFIYSTSNLDCKNITNPLLYNIGLIFTDESSVYPQRCPLTVNQENILNETKFLRIGKVPRDSFLPHFYTTKNNVISWESVDRVADIVPDSDPQMRSAVFFGEQNIGKDRVLNSLSAETGISPILEFKKINPTKYRIRIHGANGRFPMVFSENYHDGWKAYVVPGLKHVVKYAEYENYKILDGNMDDQASNSEMAGYVSKGWVTSLGDGKEKHLKHRKWVDNRPEPDYTENYIIDFISKNYQGTIQNDNLPNGKLWETWFSKPIDDNAQHLKVNGYANSWFINADRLCAANLSSCLKNKDGTYDMELIVEFWPQRFFYIGILISLTTILFCLGYSLYTAFSKTKFNS